MADIDDIAPAPRGDVAELIARVRTAVHDASQVGNHDGRAGYTLGAITLLADALEQQQRELAALRSQLNVPPSATPEQWTALERALEECDSPAARVRHGRFKTASDALRVLARFLDTPTVIAERDAADRSRVPDVLDLAARLEQLGAGLMREVSRG